MADGSQAVGLFNRGAEATPASVKWAEIGLKGSHKVHDLWRQQALGKFKDACADTVHRHGAELICVW